MQCSADRQTDIFVEANLTHKGATLSGVGLAVPTQKRLPARGETSYRCSLPVGSAASLPRAEARGLRRVLVKSS